MAATRLSDSQKQELVARFRGGEASGSLAEAFGCSANTVSRVVRTALDPKEYEALKQQRGRSAVQVAAPAGGSSQPLPLSEAGSGGKDPLATSPPGEPAPAAHLDGGGPDMNLDAPSTGAKAEEAPTAELSIVPRALAAGSSRPELPKDQPHFGGWVRQQLDGVGQASAPGQVAPGPGADSQDLPDGDQGHAALAIDDADDFADAAADDSDEEGDGAEDGDSVLGRYGDPRDGDGQTFMVLPLGQAIEDRPSLTVQPLEPADLPASVYMLVDKTVELDIKPLKELPELGALPDGEGERQALVVYANPRQAKRYCGRNQRVIKVPDSGVLARTAPYLLSQGVTRLVVEGALYSLPGS